MAEDTENPRDIHSVEAAIQQIAKVKKIEIALAANADAADDKLVNLTDPDSSVMLNDRRTVPSYNVQIATANQ